MILITDQFLTIKFPRNIKDDGTWWFLGTTITSLPIYIFNDVSPEVDHYWLIIDDMGRDIVLSNIQYEQEVSMIRKVLVYHD